MHFVDTKQLYSEGKKMAELSEDIVVTSFTTTEADQDPVHKAIFRFQFILSRSAPALWVEVAKQDVSENGRVNFCIQRKAWVYPDRIVVACTAGEAQRIKDVLTKDVLPNVNREYRRHAATAQAQQAVADAQQQGIMSEVEKAIRGQK
jgi:hypothetical protein